MLAPWFRKLFARNTTSARPLSRKRMASLHCYPRVETLEDRLAPATFAWTGLAGTGNFSSAGNWLNASTNAPGTPGTGDSLLFPNGGPQSLPATATDDLAGTTNFNSITFLSAGWTVAAKAGSTLGVTNAITDATNIAGNNTITAPLDFSAATTSVGINVVNPNGAAANLLFLNGGTVNLGSAGFTYTGFGSLGITGVVSNSTGTGGIVSNGFGTFNLGAANTYAGATTINSGLVTINNATSLGTGAVTITSGQVFNGLTTAGSLQLNATGVSNALNLNGLGFGGNGALVMNGNITFDGAITLQTSCSINVGNNIVALAGPGGTTTGSISGPGGLTVVGSPTTGINNPSQLLVEDTCSYTGVTNILGPQFILLPVNAAGQAGGTMAANSSYVVSQGGFLRVENANGAGNVVVNNRLGSAATIELDGGSLIINRNGTASRESFATLNLGNAAPGIIGSNTVNLETVNNTVTVGTLNRFPGSTVTFQGTNLGAVNGNDLSFTNAPAGGAALVNGVFPYAAAANGAGAPDGFASLATVGVVANTVVDAGTAAGGPANNMVFSAFATGGGNGTQNLVGDNPGGTLTLTGNLFVNSINFNGESINTVGGPFTITIASGGFLASSATAVTTQIINGILQFSTAANGTGPVEGIISHLNGDQLNLNATPITAGNNLTINTSGNFFNIVNNPGNSTYTGVTWVTSGKVQLLTTANADVFPTTLIIGDNAGGNLADQVIVGSTSQQIGTLAAPGNVVINSSGNLVLNAGDNQSVANLTFKSGLSEAQVNTAAALTVTGTVASGAVTLSPTAGLPGGIPDVSNFSPSAFHGTGTLVLAPAVGTTTVFNVAKTPAVFNGGEEDLHIAVAIGAGAATLDKQGAGVLVDFVLPVGYTGIVQIDGGEFASGIANFAQNIVVNAGGTLGDDAAALAGANATTGLITVNGGSVNPGLPPSPLAPSNSQNGEYLNQGTATTPNFSAGGILDLHIDAYGTTTDWDQFQGTTGANQVTLGGTSVLEVDLLGLAQSGILTGKAVNGIGASPFIWANPLIGKFSDAPNAANNILPAADVLNNPTGFQVIVTYGAGFIAVSIGHPATVSNSTYTTTQNTALTVSSRGAGVLATVTDPDFIGAESEAFLDGVANPGTLTGSAGGTLVLNANGSFTYTPVAGFTGTEAFSFQVVTPRGALSTTATVTFTVTAAPVPPVPPTPPTPPTPLPINYIAIGADAGGGPQVTVFNSATNAVVSVFYAFTPTFTGGVRVAVDDVNGDGVPDIIVAAGPSGSPQVEVIDGTKLTQLQSNGQIATSALLANFFAFNAPNFTGGVFVATAKSSSGQNWLVVGAGQGGGPEVEVFTAKALMTAGPTGTPTAFANFYAFAPTFTGGVSVAVGDTTGSGKLDLILGAGPGGGPQVIVVDGTKFAQVQSNGQIANSALRTSFYAFAPTFTGGVFVSGGVFGGQYNLIVGAGPGGGPQVIAVNGSQISNVQSNGQIANSALLDSFFALPSSFSGGVRVGFDAAFGNPGKASILTAAGPGGSPEVNVFDALSQKSLGAFFFLPVSFAGGAFVSG